MKANKNLRECATCHREYDRRKLASMELEIKPKVRLVDKIQFDGNLIKVVSTYGTCIDICPHCVKALIEELARKADEKQEVEDASK